MATIRTMSVFFLIVSALFCTSLNAGESRTEARPSATPATAYPKVVLFSTSWCPHCKEARSYFTQHGIAFTERDVEADESAMKELKTKYKSAGVPVIVIGDDQKILKGFDPDSFEKGVKEVRQKQNRQ